MATIWCLMGCQRAPTRLTPSDARLFEAALEAVADPAGITHVDPRALRAGTVRQAETAGDYTVASPDSSDLARLADAQRALRQRSVRGSGLRNADFFEAIACEATIGFSEMVIGGDTIRAAPRPPPEIIERCRASGDPAVMILELPERGRDGEGWVIHAHIRGSGTVQLWEIALDSEAEVVRTERIYAWWS